VAASSSLWWPSVTMGALYTSTDGAPGICNLPLQIVYPYWLLSVAYGNGLFVTTGEQGYIATSKNGTNWTARSIVNPTVSLERRGLAIIHPAPIPIFPYKGFWTVERFGQCHFYSTTNLARSCDSFNLLAHKTLRPTCLLYAPRLTM